MPRVEPRRAAMACGASDGGGRRYGGGCVFGRRTKEEIDGRQEKGERKKETIRYPSPHTCGLLPSEHLQCGAC
jgi:hypothetical protein